MQRLQVQAFKIYLYETQPHTGLNLGYFIGAGLVVFAVKEKLKGKLYIRVGWLDVPASIVVANNLAVTLERQLADSAAFNAKF
jgi:hypothetical protein